MKKVYIFCHSFQKVKPIYYVMEAQVALIATFSFTQQVVVFGHGPLSLVDLDQDTGLVVWVGAEGLGLFGGDGGVAFDEWCHDSTCCLDAQG